MEQETNKLVSTGAQNGRPQDSKQPPTEMDVGGKHRKLAELHRLNQESRFWRRTHLTHPAVEMRQEMRTLGNTAIWM